MDHYLPLFGILPLLMIAAALYKRTETSLWLMVVACFGFMVSMSNPVYWQLFMWIIFANSLAAAACAAHFFKTKSSVALIITLLLSVESAVNFGHLIYSANTGYLSAWTGNLTGIIGYAQLLAVLMMKDCRGSLNGLVDDFRDSFVSLLHLGDHHKRHGRH